MCHHVYSCNKLSLFYPHRQSFQGWFKPVQTNICVSLTKPRTVFQRGQDSSGDGRQVRQRRRRGVTSEKGI